MRCIDIALRGSGGTLCIGEDYSIRRYGYGADVRDSIEFTSFFKLKKKMYQIMLVLGYKVDIYKPLKSEIKNFSDLGKWSISMYGI